MTTSQSPLHTAHLDAPPGREARSPQGAIRAPRWSGVRLLTLPAALSVALASFALLTEQSILRWTFIGAAGGLLAWCAALLVWSRRARRTLTVEAVIRKQHWMQACAQGSLMLYWAANTPLVVSFLPFVVAQLVFAYAVDALLTWSRRDKHALGFAPFPIILSINLFLLFRPQWFYWQLVMIAVGLGAKELIRWTKDGRSAHIFNPSSFPLAVFSLALLLTGSTEHTFGNVIVNTQFDTPHIFLAIFLVSLPGHFLFGVARTTLGAVVTMYLCGLAYFALTGTYFFYDAYIPPAVFLGMNLLITDPSTSPKTELGRLIFGALYALSIMGLFVILERAGAPTFYDKLLAVPILNTLVQLIDRLVSRRPLSLVDPARLGASLTPGRRHAAYASVWVALFVVLSAVQGLGDRHPGQYLPFWQEACGAGSSRACTYAAQLTYVYCHNGSGWACNEVGILERKLGRPAGTEFSRACELGFTAGCENAANGAALPGRLASGRPLDRDLPILLGGTKPPIRERDPARLYALACDQGWPGACTEWSAGARR